MNHCQIIHKSSGNVLVKEGRIAQNFFHRLKGLMFDQKMEAFDGLLITRCNSIHTFFMNFNIDVIFLDKEYRIVKIKRDIKPWRMSPFYFSASSVLELKGGTLSNEIRENDQLEVICLN